MHLYFHHVRVSTMNRNNDENNIDASVKTNQIDSDGIVHLDNGIKLELSRCQGTTQKGAQCKRMVKDESSTIVIYLQGSSNVMVFKKLTS